LIIFQRAKLAMPIISHLCWCNRRTFWRKNAAGSSPRGSCSYMTNNAPAHRTFATQKKLAYLGSHRLNHQHYSPDLVPSDCHLFPGLKKKQLIVRHFSSDEQVAAAETWSIGLLPEFDLTCKNYFNVLRSVLSFVGSVLNRSKVWSK
jgi:hypothetical protein